MLVENHGIYRDAFNMLAGEKIGHGAYRDVFECKLRPEFVVKVERDEPNGYRTFHNYDEYRFWDDHKDYRAVARWLAPIEYCSPDMLIILQRRVTPIDKSKLPAKLPAFLTDLKPSNFGMLDGRLVCTDYAYTVPNPSLRLKKAEWNT